MKPIVKSFLQDKSKTMPILSFPSVQLMDIGVNALIADARLQAAGMEAIVRRCPVSVSLNMMDLSVEAEAFGAQVRFSEQEIPTVVKGAIDSIEDAPFLAVPRPGAGRTGIYLEGVRRAKEQIRQVPVFCGVIGPYSLAGRLFDMTELMMECYDSPELVAHLLDKASEFLIAYIRAFQDAGADGVVMAEPAAGLLSPALAEEFSMPYVKRILEAVDREDFVLVYHNCGNAAQDMAQSIGALPADIFHFGNAIDLKKMIPRLPADRLVMGNVDPVLLRNGTPAQVAEQTERIWRECAGFENFLLSTGCDVPADAKWENIDAYFEKVKQLYA